MQRYACVDAEGTRKKSLCIVWLCKEERMVDALALRADERRDKLRKAAGRSTYPLIRRSLNGETHLITGILA